MKVVTAKEMERLEGLAYSEGASEEVFMNQAGQGIAQIVQEAIARYHLKPNITLLCGSGNNGADAYVAGRILHEGGFQVTALSCAPREKMSRLCALQSQRFVDAGAMILYVEESCEISFDDSELLIDGILGTGFHGEVEGCLKKMIYMANASKLPIIAIDIPSGINGTTGQVAQIAIRATETVFLALPKSGCFLPEAWEHVGRVRLHNFGLEERFIEEGNEDYILIDDPLIRNILPPIARTRHKYQAGYVIGIGGSLGMAGAATMSSFATLRVGAGIVRLFHPIEMSYDFFQLPVEVIREGYPEGEIGSILKEVKRASALFIGPGMGLSSQSDRVLSELLPQLDKPCVIDADALSMLAEKNYPLPSQTILTPHHGEMKKLLSIKEKELPFQELLEMSRHFASQHQITLVLKGAPTYIIHQDEKPYICSHGDPGMATAGSGDILTGIIAGFLAQTKNPLHAALLGVQFHAKAGELAAKKWSSYAMVATDMLEQLPHIFNHYLP